MKTFEATLSLFEENPVWSYHVMVPGDIAEVFIDGTNRRVRCRLNDASSWQCALMPSPNGYFILVNRETRTKLGLEVGDSVRVTLEKDTSTYGFDVPEELSELLHQDEEGYRHFHNLTPGKQRNLIYIVSKVKNPDSRLNKALAIVHHLKEANGKLDFRQLNQTIKYYNNR